MLVAALSLWTVIPLSLGLHRLPALRTPSSRAAGPTWSCFVGIVVSILIIAWLLGRLNGLYIRITGTNTMAPMRPAWLKSMRDTPTSPPAPTVLEAVIVGSVMLAVLALAIWFFVAGRQSAAEPVGRRTSAKARAWLVGR